MYCNLSILTSKEWYSFQIVFEFYQLQTIYPWMCYFKFLFRHFYIYLNIWHLFFKQIYCTYFWSKRYFSRRPNHYLTLHISMSVIIEASPSLSAKMRFNVFIISQALIKCCIVTIMLYKYVFKNYKIISAI